MTAAWLKSLEEVEGGDLPLVGGKAFNLATLRRHGLPVLPGLVATTAFFEAQLHHYQVVPLWAGSPDAAITEDALCWLADTLRTSPLAPELDAALQAGLSHIFPDIETFAVRSSAVDEDTQQHAFSGIYLTELEVPAEIIPISIAHCWAAAFSKGALEYRRKQGLSIQSIRMAVLIQPFIRSRAAGVAFTINPLSGAQDEMLVEAVCGQGKAVVEGSVTPTRYRLSKCPPDYTVLERTPGDAHRASRSAEMLHDAGHVSPLCDEHNPLSPEIILKLAEYLEQIEALMAGPQDVEWAIAEASLEGDERLVFLQARPITGLPGSDASYDTVWSRASFREFLPDLPSPMCTSVLLRSQNQVLSFFNQLGFKTDRTGPYIRLLYGRPYLNLTLARRLLAQSGLHGPDILWIVGHSQRSGDQSVSDTIDWRQMWEARRSIGRLLWQGMHAESWQDRFQRLVDEVQHSLAETRWPEASPADLLARFRHRTRLCDQLTQGDFLMSAAILALVGLAVQVAGSSTDQVGQVVREALDSDRKANDQRHGQRLLELAAVARADQQALNHLSRHADSFADYRDILARTPFLAAFDSFLADYGDTAAFEADPGWPRYGEDPSPLLAAIAQMIRVELPANPRDQATIDNHPGDKPTPAQVGADDSQRARPWVGGKTPELPPWRRWLADQLSKRLHRLARLRARLQALFGQAMSSCRVWDLKLALRWTAQGWLSEPEDYFWLTMEEVERALIAEPEVGPTLAALVRARRDTYQMYAATEMPHTLRESDIGRLVAGHGLMGSALASVLSGLPLSPGQVQGEVVILLRPEESSRMQEGAILVTPSTDPTWFPLFSRAKGLIVETGGLLSHGSIIAREFGVPAVANIADATRRFHNGDLVLLDGSTGLIQILDTAREGVP